MRRCQQLRLPDPRGRPAQDPPLWPPDPVRNTNIPYVHGRAEDGFSPRMRINVPARLHKSSVHRGHLRWMPQSASTLGFGSTAVQSCLAEQATSTACTAPAC